MITFIHRRPFTASAIVFGLYYLEQYISHHFLPAWAQVLLGLVWVVMCVVLSVKLYRYDRKLYAGR